MKPAIGAFPYLIPNKSAISRFFSWQGARPGSSPWRTGRDAPWDDPDTRDREKFPLTLADGLRTAFGDAVSTAPPARLAALMRLPMILTSGHPPDRGGDLPSGVIYTPRPWQPLEVLIAAEEAIASAY
jgi:hypothetical protein